MIKALKPSTLTAILHIYSCTSRFNHDVKILWHNISLGYHIEQNRSKFPSNWIELELLSSNLFGLGSVIERNGTQNFSVSSISERNRTKSFDFVRFFRKSNFELKSKIKRKRQAREIRLTLESQGVHATIQTLCNRPGGLFCPPCWNCDFPGPCWFFKKSLVSFISPWCRI